MAETQFKPILFYTGGSPNGHKISITLEELDLKYDMYHIKLSKNEQKEDWFLKINPNGRIPAIVDKSNNNFRVFESGSIMLYLIDKYDKNHKISFEHGTNLYYEMVSWLFFQNAGIGPMQGQAHHFVRYAPEKIDYAIKRYQNETRRLYSVLETRLKENGDWLVGDKMTIADIAIYPWVNVSFYGDIDMSEFPKLREWSDRIFAREAVRRGMDVPVPFDWKLKEDKQRVSDRAKANVDWILKGQQADAEKKYS